jgi:hypothetical protein
MTAFWDVSLCSLVEMTGVSEVHTAPIIRTMTGVVSISETSVSFYQTAQSNIPEEDIFSPENADELSV